MHPSQLRSRSISELLDTAVRLYRAHAVQLLALSAIVLLPTTLLRVLLVASSPFAVYLIESLQNIFLIPLLCAALTTAGVRIYANQSFTLPQMLRAGLRRGLSVLGASVIEGAAIGLAIVALGGGLIAALTFVSRSPDNPWLWALAALVVIPCVVVLAAKYAVAIPALVVEGLNARNGVRRSWALTKGRLWPTAVVLTATTLLTLLVAQAPSLVLTTLSSALLGSALLGGGPDVAWLAGLQIVLVQVGLAITLPLQYLVPVVLYYDLRIRNEGYDLEQQAASGLANAAPARA